MDTVLASNPYFSAGAGLIGLTATIAVTRSAALRTAQILRRRLLVTLEISNRDVSYPWFLHWMSQEQLRSAHRSGGIFAGSVARTHQLAVQTSLRQLPEAGGGGIVGADVKLVPGPGRHFLRYKRAWMMVDRERDGRLTDLATGTPFETVMITTLSRDRTLLAELLHEAREMAIASTAGRTVIYTSWGPDWRPFGAPRRRRLLSSVVLAQGVAEDLLSDVREFLAREKWYAARGIPYRRGYLLHGPPGTGKTSFVMALAGELEYNICVLNLSERGLTDDRLMHLLVNTPERSLLLLEDVDAAFSARSPTSDPSATKREGPGSLVTFSGLLNALDGVASAEDRIIFMTTNHPERLDPALIRPGRADIRVAIDHSTAEQTRRMFLRFYPDQHTLADAFVTRVGDREVSTAALQGLFVWCKEDPQRVIDIMEPALFRGQPGIATASKENYHTE